jgi:hypothetical protein
MRAGNPTPVAALAGSEDDISNAGTLEAHLVQVQASAC